MTTLYDFTMAFTITTAVLLLLKKLFWNKMSARWHYLLWLVLLVRLFVPFLPQSGASVFNVVERAPAYIQQQAAQRFPDAASPGGALEAAATQNTKNLAHASLAEQNGKTPPGSVVLGVWLAGAVILMGYFLFTYFLFCIKARKSRAICDGETLATLEEAKACVGVQCRVKVAEGETPMLRGVFTPVIYLPGGFTQAEKKDIFLHELCHFHHGDVPATLFAMALLCLQWFNPAAWLGFFTFKKDVERYCDARAMAHVASKKDYARLLVKTASAKGRAVPATTCLQNGEKGVAARVRYIALFKKPKFYVTLLALAAVIAAAVLCLTNAINQEGVSKVGGAQHEGGISVEKNLYAYKSAYVGDAVNTTGLIDSLPFAGYRREIALETEHKPYGVTVRYGFGFRDYGDIENILWKNAAVVFALIDNVDEVCFCFTDQTFCVDRESARARFGDLAAAGASQEAFAAFLENKQIDTGGIVPLKTAVDAAVLKSAAGYYGGECPTAGSVILRTEPTGEAKGDTKVYAITSCGKFGVENNVFTKISGSWTSPTVIILDKDYKVISYQEPKDGAYYEPSVKEMFPQDLWDEAMAADDYYDALKAQEEAMARAYLISVGRDLVVTADYVEKEDYGISTGARNAMLELEKGVLANYPYWLGSLERMENGVRYVYEAAWEGDALTFTKRVFNTGETAERHAFRVAGDLVTKIE